MTDNSYKPKAKTTEFLTRTVGDDEKVVYDRSNDRVHCLNHTANLLLELSDGTRTTEDLRQELGKNLGTEIGGDVVLLGLDQLAKARLLEESTLPRPLAPTRRQILEGIGAGAALAALLPVVASILAPTAASASTCLQTGHACASNFQCCSGLCVSSTCA